MPEELHEPAGRRFESGLSPAMGWVAQADKAVRLFLNTLSSALTTMNLHELEAAIDLQKRAYALLLWLGKNGPTRPSLLDEESLSAPSFCEHWLRGSLSVLPSELRPAADELQSFARVLTSFFNTSFHIDHHHGGGRRLVRGQGYSDARHRRHAGRRANERAHELVSLALEALAREENVGTSPQMLEDVTKDASVGAALNLWAYGCELVRRTKFASQGPAVHDLWLQMDEMKRKRLTAESIWKARAQVLAALKRHSVL